MQIIFIFLKKSGFYKSFLDSLKEIYFEYFKAQFIYKKEKKKAIIIEISIHTASPGSNDDLDSLFQIKIKWPKAAIEKFCWTSFEVTRA